MRAVVVANGPLPTHPFCQHLVEDNDLVICVDGGAGKALALGLMPEVVIGDMDSLEAPLREQLRAKGCRFIEYPSRKDETDSELAIRHALSLGATEIIMLGMLGARIDHSLANIMLLTLPELEQVKVRLVEGCQEVFVIRDEILIEGMPGDTLSLLPLSGDVVGVRTEGLEYPLHYGTLRFGAARGVSNVLTASRAKITVGSGLLLVVHHHSGWAGCESEHLEGGENG